MKTLIVQPTFKRNRWSWRGDYRVPLCDLMKSALGRIPKCIRCDFQGRKCYGFQEGGESWREERVTMHFRDKYKWDKGLVWVTLRSSLSRAGACLGLHSLALLPSPAFFSSMGCEHPRVPVLITDERCRAWTPGLTSQRDSLWDHFSPNGICMTSTQPSNKV